MCKINMIGEAQETTTLCGKTPCTSVQSLLLGEKLNMTSVTVAYKVIPKASTQFSYHYSGNQNLDFAADESGLWVTIC